MDAARIRPERGLPRRRLLSTFAVTVAGLGTIGAGATWSRPQSAGRAAPATMDPSTPAPPSPTPDLFAEARTRIEAYVRDTGGRTTVAVRDQVAGTELTVGDRRFQTASIVKVDILAALLLREQDARRELNAADRERARSMIVVSDNAAASALYQQVGRVAGLITANRAFGLRETTPDPHWGQTTTTAADQVRLLAAITATSGPLDLAGRQLLLELMSQVQADQRWGITAAVSPETTDTYVKNGWVQVDSDGGRWQVNSIGRLVEPGHDWLIAVLSDHHATASDGVRMVERVAEYTLRELRGLAAVTVP
jgi:beta-lactamase class A